MAEQKTDDVRIEPYDGPAGGWGSARSLVEILTREGVPVTGSAMLLKQNKPDGYMCTSCAWATWRWQRILLSYSLILACA